MTLTFREAVEFAAARRVELPSEYYGQLQGQQRDLAFSIAGVAQRDQLQGVLDSLNQVLEKGMTFSDWKAAVKGGAIGLDLPDYRLDNIFRTNMQTAYSAGHWTQQQRNKASRPYLMYDAVNDGRTRPSHLKLDNVIKPIDDPFWATYGPLNGYRCRCSTIALTEAQAQARGGVTEEPEGGWPEPDKGWDYNPGAEPMRGVEQAMEPRPGGNSQIQQAMEDAISDSDTTTADLIKVLDATRTEASMDQLLSNLEEAKAAALQDPDLVPSLEALASLTDDQQAFLRIVSEEARPMRSAALDLPSSLGLRGDAGSAATRLSAEVFSQFEAGDAPALYRVPPTGFRAQMGQTITLDGISSFSASVLEGAHQVLVFEAGNSSAIPVAAISSQPQEMEWLFPPETQFRVTRIDGPSVFIEEVRP